MAWLVTHSADIQKEFDIQSNDFEGQQWHNLQAFLFNYVDVYAIIKVVYECHHEISTMCSKPDSLPFGTGRGWCLLFLNKDCHPTDVFYLFIYFDLICK